MEIDEEKHRSNPRKYLAQLEKANTKNLCSFQGIDTKGRVNLVKTLERILKIMGNPNMLDINADNVKREKRESNV
jgi:hypothetical protein